MKKVAIVVPVYLQTPKKDEIISFNQAKKILGKYPIILVCPDSLDTKEYEFLTTDVERFDDKFFKGVKAYSELCLRKDFYERFRDYEYIMIYQGDGYVFRDELEYWCNQGFDYIGAPWFEGYDDAKPDADFIKFVGNGGMSLRNVQKHISLFENKFQIHSYKDLADENKKKKLISNILNIPVNLIRFFEQFFVPTSKLTRLNEDFYIAKYGPKLKDFKIPKPEDALKFAFENLPERLFEMNNKQLPFVCHAYLKYNYDFWKQFIPREIQDE